MPTEHPTDRPTDEATEGAASSTTPPPARPKRDRGPGRHDDGLSRRERANLQREAAAARTFGALARAAAGEEAPVTPERGTAAPEAPEAVPAAPEATPAPVDTPEAVTAPQEPAQPVAAPAAPAAPVIARAGQDTARVAVRADSGRGVVDDDEDLDEDEVAIKRGRRLGVDAAQVARSLSTRPPARGKYRARVDAQLPGELVDELVAFCSAHGTDRTKVLQRLVEDLVESNKRRTRER